MPLYKVTPSPKKMPTDAKARMISAANQSAALRFATKDCYACEVIDAEEAAELGAQGIKVEKAEAGE